MGWYDRQHRTIHVTPGLSQAQTLVTLQHELVHARHALQGTMSPDPNKEEYRTRRETALALVNALDYMIVEQCYGPNTWQITSQLSLIPAIVRDWQAIVRDDPQLARA